jgi:hypothetical protein
VVSTALANEANQRAIESTSATASFCSELSGDACASSQDAFSVTTPNVYVSWSIPELRDGVRFRVTWFRNGQPTGAPDLCTVQRNRCVTTSRDITPT